MKSCFKSITSTILVLCMIFTVMIVPVVFADEEQPITVFVDGVQLNFDVNPTTQDDRTLVPMRYIFEALGATVAWDDETSTAIAIKGDDTIVIAVDSTIMMKNDQEIALDVPARLIDDRTLVPVRAVSEGLGASVAWDENIKQVNITKSVEETPAPTATPETTVTPEPTATATPAPTATPTATNSPTTNTYQKLSDKDMKALKDSYNNLIRYGFEQSSFPDSVLKDNADIVKEIKAKSDVAKQFAYDIWNKVVIAKILEIQIKSESSYAISDVKNEEELKSNYMNIVKEAGLEASSYFDVSFETLKDNSTLMLLTFKATDTLLACKYIGVVVKSDNSVRYFTAETDMMDKENLYFCEVTKDQRGTIGTMKFEKSDFINAINADPKGMSASQNR